MPTMNRIILSLTLLAALLPASARAGVYADELSKCIVDRTTPEDRTAFVRWMFAAASRHPAVRSLVTIPEAQLDAANRQTAALMMKVFTESCREQTEKAVKYEGTGAFSAGFQVFGQVAGNELFSHPEVAAAMAGLEKYLDGEKLAATLGAAGEAK